ncbi:DNA-binding protein [Auricularia subglabra TFB-10046 SS5]|nr:DNA-binding protein [Auricularia subglabra TFB-10046 SS5]
MEPSADDDAPALSYNALVRALSELFEVAIHTLLFVRGVYPENLFVRRRKYNTAVFQARHPALRDYISRACASVREELLLGTVARLAVVISDGPAPLERFVFDVARIADLEPTDELDEPINDGLDADALAQRFRGFMLKLAGVEGMLRPLSDLSDDTTFAIVLELTDGAVPTAAEPTELPPWVPAQRQHTTTGVRAASGATAERYVSAIDTQIFRVGLSVQEACLPGKNKKQHKSGDNSQDPPPTISISSAK